MLQKILVGFAVVLGGPVFVYFLVKFGTTGYLVAKQRFKERNKHKQQKAIHEQTE
jgi:hypothetical protein